MQAANMRAAANHEIQSPGAEITKAVQRRLWDLQPAGIHPLKLAPLNIHDELMVVANPSIVHDITAQRPRSRGVLPLESAAGRHDLVRGDGQLGGEERRGRPGQDSSPGDDVMARICKPVHGPEWHIQKDVIRFLEARGWNVEHTHGNLYQTGFPDLYAAHKKWGTRWIDCKQPKKYSFTRAQKQKWPVWEAYGIGIWILTAATQAEYDKLFAAPNWRSVCQGKLESAHAC